MKVPSYVPINYGLITNKIHICNSSILCVFGQRMCALSKMWVMLADERTEEVFSGQKNI